MLDTQTYTHTHTHSHFTIRIYTEAVKQWQPFSIGKQFWQENSVATEVQVSHFLCNIFTIHYLPRFSIAKYVSCTVCVNVCVFAFFNRFEIYFHLITWETSWSQIFLCNSVKKMRANICMPVYNVHVRVCVSFGSTEVFFSQIHTLSIFDT